MLNMENFSQQSPRLRNTRALGWNLIPQMTHHVHQLDRISLIQTCEHMQMPEVKFEVKTGGGKRTYQ